MNKTMIAETGGEYSKHQVVIIPQAPEEASEVLKLFGQELPVSLFTNPGFWIAVAIVCIILYVWRKDKHKKQVVVGKAAVKKPLKRSKK